MPSSDAMFEASSMYFQYVNERSAPVKYTVFPVGVDLGRGQFLNSLIVGLLVFGYWGFMNEI